MDIIPDSSFFICFMDDLEGYLPFSERIRYLMAFISHYSILLTSEVERESRWERIPVLITDGIRRVKVQEHLLQSVPAIELLRPLLGKGEHEVISCAQVHLMRGGDLFLFIIDDGVARDLVRQSLPDLVRNMKGTVGFIGYCSIQKVLETSEVIGLLTLIDRSKFRVDHSVLKAIIADIEKQCD